MKEPLSHVELSSENLLHNVTAFRAMLGDEKKLVAVVKANAYGHGMKELYLIKIPLSFQNDVMGLSGSGAYFLNKKGAASDTLITSETETLLCKLVTKPVSIPILMASPRWCIAMQSCYFVSYSRVTAPYLLT